MISEEQLINERPAPFVVIPVRNIKVVRTRDGDEVLDGPEGTWDNANDTVHVNRPYNLRNDGPQTGYVYRITAINSHTGNPVPGIASMRYIGQGINGEQRFAPYP